MDIHAAYTWTSWLSKKKNKPSFEEVTQKEGGKSLTKQKKADEKMGHNTTYPEHVAVSTSNKFTKRNGLKLKFLKFGSCFFLFDGWKKTFKHLHKWWSSSGIPSKLTWRYDAYHPTFNRNYIDSFVRNIFQICFRVKHGRCKAHQPWCKR